LNQRGNVADKIIVYYNLDIEY